jgi:hypothetical protein
LILKRLKFIEDILISSQQSLKTNIFAKINDSLALTPGCWWKSGTFWL